MEDKLNILLVAAEVAPYAKVGGLADVVGALPKALKAMGHDVRVVMPCYKMVESNPKFTVSDLLPTFSVPINDQKTEWAAVKQTLIADDIPVYLIRHKRYFTEATESKKLYSLEPEPYIFFSRAVLEMVPRLKPEWRPDVIHCNDWHTGLCPVYLRQYYSNTSNWQNCASVFTIHNLAYQGEYDRDMLVKAGLPESLFTYERLEFYGRFNFLKAGLVYSDMINTVSETYAKEIQTAEYGCRMEGLLRYLDSEGKLTGIVNGIDYEEYNPATDPRIPFHYSAEDLDGKWKNKGALQREVGLPETGDVPLIAVISRLADQKGFDLIAEIAPKLMRNPIQLIVLGTGEPKYETFFTNLQKSNPQRVSAKIGFDPSLAQRIYAGSDLFLMPSRFEPCGLGQLMSMRYGSIPIARFTGGLADTVGDVIDAKSGTGFIFANYEANELLKTIKRAVRAYENKEEWYELVSRAMSQDFSWNSSARSYVALYLRSMDQRMRLAA